MALKLRIIEDINKGVSTLDCSKKGLTDDDAIELAGLLKNNHTIKTLRLGHNEIGPAGIKAIADVLKDNTTITHLDIFSNRTTGNGGAKAIADLLRHNHTIVRLDLLSNGIDAEGATALANALAENEGVEVLYLGGNNLSDVKSCKAFAGMLEKNSTLTHLYVDGTKMSDAGVTAFAQGLKQNTALEALAIGTHQFGDAGIKGLCDALIENKALGRLNLQKTHLSALGAAHLGRMLKASTPLTELLLSDCNLGEGTAAITALASGLKANHRLEKLSVSHNELETEGAQILIEAVEGKPHLKEIYFNDNNIETLAARQFAGLVPTLPSLMSVSFKSNPILPEGIEALADAFLSHGHKNIIEAFPSTTPLMNLCEKNGDIAAMFADLLDGKKPSELDTTELHAIAAHQSCISHYISTEAFSLFVDTLPLATPNHVSSPDDLLKPDANGYTMLDNPKSWEQLPAICDALAAKGAPLAVEQLLTLNHDGEPAVLAGFRCMDAAPLVEALNRNGQYLRADSLLGEDRKPSPLLKALAENSPRALRSIFTQGNWQGANINEMLAVHSSLPAKAKESVSNLHALTATMRRTSSVQAGRA